jgi:long-subunit acyl-CoA synthetase (AMP-forming)
VGKPLKQECFDDDSIGKPLPGVAVKIVDPNNHSVELLNDATGLIFVKGPSINANTFDGWFNTGKTGSLDHKGFIHGEG